jgi:prolyl-tRNA editing enzyme YbaK/EbsC (Cys-tRNA(Pro) deacylase)
MSFDVLKFVPVKDRLDLVAAPVAAFFSAWRGKTPADDIWVAEIDPQFAGGVELCQHYGIDPRDGANCVVVEARRGANSTFAAVVTPVGYKRDLNGVVRRYLGARQVSLGPLETVLARTQMEYGSITAVGLPVEWPVLVDPLVVSRQRVLMGSGLKHSKLSLPGHIFAELTSAIVLDGLAIANE